MMLTLASARAASVLSNTVASVATSLLRLMNDLHLL
jgi:hypothetical protein